MEIETKFDKRLVERDGKPPGYDKYLATLRCCCCGSREPCNCTKEDFLNKKKGAENNGI